MRSQSRTTDDFYISQYHDDVPSPHLLPPVIQTSIVPRLDSLLRGIGGPESLSSVPSVLHPGDRVARPPARKLCRSCHDEKSTRVFSFSSPFPPDPPRVSLESPSNGRRSSHNPVRMYRPQVRRPFIVRHRVRLAIAMRWAWSWEGCGRLDHPLATPNAPRRWGGCRTGELTGSHFAKASPCLPCCEALESRHDRSGEIRHRHGWEVQTV
jgi:hypothetical protein